MCNVSFLHGIYDSFYIASGLVSTLAGSGERAYIDGQETSAGFNNPLGVCVDSIGNVFVADTWNHRIRKITTGTGTTIFTQILAV